MTFTGPRGAPNYGNPAGGPRGSSPYFQAGPAPSPSTLRARVSCHGRCGGTLPDGCRCTSDCTPSGSSVNATRGCVAGAEPQFFAPEMTGCGGKIGYNIRGSLCAAGYVPCSLKQYTQFRQRVVPAAHYWLDDRLSNGGTSDKCFVIPYSPSAPGCADSSMLVCNPNGRDRYGNVCTWTNCGYLSPNSNAYMGGCSEGTAGTLCCASPAMLALSTNACCSDFQETCVAPVAVSGTKQLPGTCAGSCGGKGKSENSLTSANAVCRCDSLCTYHDDCCADFVAVCATCAGRCGASATGGCACDRLCLTLEDCCADFTAVCSAQGPVDPLIFPEQVRDPNGF